MKRYGLIRVGVIALCFVLSAGCGKKKEAEEKEHGETKKEHGETKKGEGEAEKEHGEKKAEAKDSVQLTDENLKLVHIEMAPVARGPWKVLLRTAGRVAFNANHTAKVTSTFEGRIAKMNHDLGDTVQQGELMALIESPEFLNKPLELKAPMSGQVVERQGAVGEIVDKAKELYTISDLQNIWVIADVYPNDIAAVGVGQPATLHLLASKEPFTGKVLLVGHQVEEKSRTIDVRIEVANQGGKLKPGVFTQVEIVTGLEENILAVPEEAIQRIENDDVAFVSEDGKNFTKRVVKLGRAQDGKVEILEGLKDGERVATKGSIILKSELLKSELGE